ncbi:MAG TPA: DoxX family protein [Candidatus Dormibacteraeota bacterium]|nr:DoxX family protein [Candidatus Dormibacteraeota bacterium]
MNFLKRFSDQLYSLMRLIAGCLFACHGAQKLFGVLGSPRLVHVPLMLAAGIIEFFGGLLIALGAFTAIAAFVASGEMATAYFLQHAPHGFWPIRNHGELAVLFCFVFLYIASQGDGVWSARGLLKGKRR